MSPTGNDTFEGRQGQEPTYESVVRRAITQLNDAASIPSDQTTLGHLIHTVGAKRLQVLDANNAAFVVPANKGAIVIPNNASAAVIAEKRRQHDYIKKAYKTFYAVDAALKSQLISATDEIYIKTLKHREHGFALTMTRDIITHLLTNYGRFTTTSVTTEKKAIEM
jgi:hypothetical protein